MEEEKSIFSRLSSWFDSEKKEDEVIVKSTESEESFWDNVINYTSSTYNSIAQSTSENYNATIDFISEKGISIYNNTAESFVEITQKVGEVYNRIEIKDSFYKILSNIDISSLLEKLNGLEVENKKTKNALKVVISLLNIFEKHKNISTSSSNNIQNINEEQKVNEEVSSLIKDINLKDILREVKPYILYIPHPAAPIIYQLLSFLC